VLVLVLGGTVGEGVGATTPALEHFTAPSSSTQTLPEGQYLPLAQHSAPSG